MALIRILDAANVTPYPLYLMESLLTPTLLLDLDDTLLINNMDAFLPQYLSIFSQHVAEHIPPEIFIQTLLIGTQAMVNNRRPDCTLQDVFDQAFFSQVNVDADKFRQLAESFYQDIFPSLQHLTRPAEGAVDLVKQASERGYRLAVATNPLFPITAITQRLAWANLGIEKNHLQAITSYESYHFAKPEPAYYAELLARLGWPDGPVVMVGDDLARDIVPAGYLGLATYYVGPNHNLSPNEELRPTASGQLSDLIEWMEHVPQKDITPTYNTPSAIMAVFRSTPAFLDSLCRDLPRDIWVRKPGPREWCLTEILCHMRDVEAEVNLPRVEKLLSEDNPFIAGKDTDQWADERGYINEDGKLALEQFTATRSRLLDKIENLSQDEWNLPARHAIFGPTRLLEIASIAAAHDRLHVQQALQLQQISQLTIN